MDTTRNKLIEEVFKVLRTSDEFLETFRKQIENKNVIMFLGNTGSGKSTVINHVLKVPLVAYEENGCYKIRRENVNDDGPSVDHETVSHTLVPVVFEMEDGDTLLVDAPGFDDNRGAVQEIINALYINQIKYGKGTRIVLVSDINNLVTDDISYFLNFIETVQMIIPDFTKLSPAICIIFTKDQNNYDQKGISQFLEKKVVVEKFMKHKSPFVKHFTFRRDLIGLFQVPTVAGPISDEIDVNVRGAIFRAWPLDLRPTDVRFGVSNSASIFLLETYFNFDDVIIFITKLVENFCEIVLQQIWYLSRDNVMNLSEEQLAKQNNIEHVVNNYIKNIEKFKRRLCLTKQMPIFLRILFVEEFEKFTHELREIGFNIPKETCIQDVTLSAIEEIHKKLEYICSIEKIINMDNKSNIILRNCKSCMHILCDDLKAVLLNVTKEIHFRKELMTQIVSIPNIYKQLMIVNDAYLSASTSNELLKIQKIFEYYLRILNDILKDVSNRPSFEHYYKNQIYNARLVVSNINLIMTDIKKHLQIRNEEVVLQFIPPRVKNILGSLMFTLGIWTFGNLSRTGQLFMTGGSALVFSSLALKSKYLHPKVARVFQRYKQGRLLRRQRVLDDYFNMLIPKY